jgi:hypothetical protein
MERPRRPPGRALAAPLFPQRPAVFRRRPAAGPARSSGPRPEPPPHLQVLQQLSHVCRQPGDVAAVRGAPAVAVVAVVRREHAAAAQRDGGRVEVERAAGAAPAWRGAGGMRRAAGQCGLANAVPCRPCSVRWAGWRGAPACPGRVASRSRRRRTVQKHHPGPAAAMQLICKPSAVVQHKIMGAGGRHCNHGSQYPRTGCARGSTDDTTNAQETMTTFRKFHTWGKGDADDEPASAQLWAAASRLAGCADARIAPPGIVCTLWRRSCVLSAMYDTHLSMVLEMLALHG